jgi:hypothetical protein
VITCGDEPVGALTVSQAALFESALACTAGPVTFKVSIWLVVVPTETELNVSCVGVTAMVFAAAQLGSTLSVTATFTMFPPLLGEICTVPPCEVPADTLLYPLGSIWTVMMLLVCVLPVAVGDTLIQLGKALSLKLVCCCPGSALTVMVCAAGAGLLLLATQKVSEVGLAVIVLFWA